MKKKLVIIGGGISGLATAYYVNQWASCQGLELDITVVEARSSLGGCLETFFSQHAVMEGGAESFITEKPWALELCKALGIEDKLISTNSDQRKSFVYSRNKLRQVPTGFYLTAPGSIPSFLTSGLLSWKGKIRVLMDLFIVPKKEHGEESVAGFIRRRFGRECLERVGQPMIGGIYGGDVELLSMDATFPNLLKMEKEHGSVIKGLMHRGKEQGAEAAASGPRYSLFMSFKEGMQTMIDALRKELPNVFFKTDCRVEKIERSDGWVITLNSSEILTADLVCLATSLGDAAKLLKPALPSLSRDLASVVYESALTVNLLYSQEVFSSRPAGFGFVVPEIEKSPMLGCTFVSNKFKNRTSDEKFLLRAFLATSRLPHLFDLSDETIVEMTQQEIRRILGVLKNPLETRIIRYEKVLPQYQLGHQKHMEMIAEQISDFPGLFITGNAFEGTGVPDCIHHAEKVSRSMMDYVQKKKANMVKA